MKMQPHSNPVYDVTYGRSSFVTMATW